MRDNQINERFDACSSHSDQYYLLILKPNPEITLPFNLLYSAAAGFMDEQGQKRLHRPKNRYPGPAGRRLRLVHAAPSVLLAHSWDSIVFSILHICWRSSLPLTSRDRLCGWNEERKKDRSVQTVYGWTKQRSHVCNRLREIRSHYSIPWGFGPYRRGSNLEFQICLRYDFINYYYYYYFTLVV